MEGTLEKIMNVENEWDQMVKVNNVEGIGATRGGAEGAEALSLMNDSG